MVMGSEDATVTQSHKHPYLRTSANTPVAETHVYLAHVSPKMSFDIH